MHTFPRKEKSTPGAYYFGDFDDVPLAPFSISQASFDRDTYQPEKRHYHTTHQKAFLTLEGEGVLNVDGREVIMNPDVLIHVEPGEVHFVQEVRTRLLKFIVILAKKENDKVVLG
jgi:quercetin dioxygenase-like cupin family protein